MISWLAALAGTVYTAVAGYRSVLRNEGAEALSRRVPLVGMMTVLAASGLAAATLLDPTQWWNYFLLPGSAQEWYTVAAWFQRRREAGGVQFPFRRTPTRSSPLVLAALAVLGAAMDIRADGLAPANVLMVAIGASNVAVYVALERAKPGLARAGVLLFEHLIPWSSVRRWTLAEPSREVLELEVDGAQPTQRTFGIDPTAAAPLARFLMEHSPPREDLPGA